MLDPFDDFKGVLRRDSVLACLDDLHRGGPCRRRVVPPLDSFDPETGEPLGSRDYAEDFFRLAVRYLRNCTIVLDEMSLWTESSESETFQKLVLQGRRWGLKMVIACQRIQLIPGVALSEGTELVVFRLRRPRDLEVIREWGGKDVRDVVPYLTQGQCVVVDL